MGTTPNGKYEPERVEPSSAPLTLRPSAADRLAADARKAFLGAIYFDEPEAGK
ncbi:hypothetical protein [Promicromonospora sp. NFX87]|uniref:hypothetical protein n=1 Tax=Promicromonospora sp. NFX87 TaxID=3402691 RepID=UPI003AFB124E